MGYFFTPTNNQKTTVTILDHAKSGGSNYAPGVTWSPQAIATTGPSPVFVYRCIGRSAEEDAVALTKMSDGTVRHLFQRELQNTGSNVYF
jgi:hypothetical protein